MRCWQEEQPPPHCPPQLLPEGVAGQLAKMIKPITTKNKMIEKVNNHILISSYFKKFISLKKGKALER